MAGALPLGRSSSAHHADRDARDGRGPGVHRRTSDGPTTPASVERRGRGADCSYPCSQQSPLARPALLLPCGCWTSGGQGLLGALPRSYQVTPNIPTGEERHNKRKSDPTGRQPQRESQLAARSRTSPERPDISERRIETASLKATAPSPTSTARQRSSCSSEAAVRWGSRRFSAAGAARGSHLWRMRVYDDRSMTSVTPSTIKEMPMTSDAIATTGNRTAQPPRRPPPSSG
jgi:hypothetical protein